MNNKHKIVYITCPQNESDKIIKSLLNEKLTACVNKVKGIESIYWWKQKLETAIEDLLICKTNSRNIDRLIKHIKKIHSYDVPEIIITDIVKGNRDYLDWIDNSVR